MDMIPKSNFSEFCLTHFNRGETEVLAIRLNLAYFSVYLLLWFGFT